MVLGLRHRAAQQSSTQKLKVLPPSAGGGGELKLEIARQFRRDERR
jgi:hypothetical protein